MWVGKMKNKKLPVCGFGHRSLELLGLHPVPRGYEVVHVNDWLAIRPRPKNPTEKNEIHCKCLKCGHVQCMNYLKMLDGVAPKCGGCEFKKKFPEGNAQWDVGCWWAYELASGNAKEY